MAMSRLSNKTLVVAGSGATMATGNLIYMLGGINLQDLDKLHQKSINSYEKAVQELKDANELYFYTPRHRVTVKDRTESADGLLLVVTPPLQAADGFFTQDIVDEVKSLESFFMKGKAIILVKTPETHERSESEYNDLVRSIKAALQNLGISAESTPFIPSNLHGENFIELSPKTPWYNSVTLVTSLDEIL
ncbi:hypothetical protein COCC4DRAFT_65394 [Bipolaris maydis ATCC 48331]|uniref:Uncharacterized protein n=3 Tax=Cochliobolus heterostrophus TaxID=5016 RepID=M2V5N5_COCH5|nr:uncharacterized protein COCC4DRAFT_65394 [Bipolaris maydis ATCC 48331]EMD95293.1 hypothetical protein COCHEDRAFT_1153108 [Bipolaris maydis C5]ENI00441.1 hypothetical protein COCC4DRAFT_65394 [Bipolaris maydis ATCC 48331]KAJ5035235.1 hypothetical protein J3E74DRAFT_423707 [Bipolaris maydis]KAJ5055079.1 hypothetical protein J3E74DRAFT_478447 [Bipolaris maydis]